MNQARIFTFEFDNDPEKKIINSVKDRCRLTFNERKEENGAVEWTNRSVSFNEKVNLFDGE